MAHSVFTETRHIGIIQLAAQQQTAAKVNI